MFFFFVFLSSLSLTNALIFRFSSNFSLSCVSQSASNSILAALFARGFSVTDGKEQKERHGRGGGQYIDMALWDCQLALLSYRAQEYLDTGTIPQRLGNAHPNIVPYDSLPTLDGFIILAVGNDSQFLQLTRVR